LKENKVNEQIRSFKVNLIGLDGTIKLLETRIALNIANTENLDLVEISQKDGFPLCKLIDYGKFKYEQAKKIAENKKNQPKNLLKEIRLSPRIDKHDIEIKVNQVKKFLDENCKVQISVNFRGRENSYKEIGYQILENFKLENVNITGPKSEGNTITMLLTKSTS
jgi:translation initiation factor IF-3